MCIYLLISNFFYMPYISVHLFILYIQYLHLFSFYLSFSPTSVYFLDLPRSRVTPLCPIFIRISPSFASAHPAHT